MACLAAKERARDIMRLARQMTLGALVALAHLAACSSNSDSSSVAGNTGGSGPSTGTGGSAGSTGDNACKQSNCPNEVNPIEDFACSLLLRGKCKAEFEAAYACALAHDECNDAGMQRGGPVIANCDALRIAAASCQLGDAGI
jgi:hypothetical protein